ncbi:hypothetical protein WICPIJ_000714 [Wickerhamomyces pijperi]|uniref:[Histone H3]-trimethyl-L-lysine(9) demethylase n=1 Tax=Wickerhamomyces pijperi TaxID=599730 RepID=A0A9P8TRD7_WICPI|nr:hypothetical protein WICPIJ_000714 [Wickerhamomyces pijperi]
MVYPSEILTGVPIFEPTMEEFADFENYMSLLTPFGLKSGIVKIRPPAEWKESLPEVTPELLKGIKIKNPISQHISGGKGIFREANIEKQKCYNIVQWKALSQDSSYQPPAGKGKMRNDGLDKKTLQKNKEILRARHEDEEMFEGFDFHIDTEEFTTERCLKLEKSYWTSLNFSEPLYGADVEGTLFDDRVKTWNLRELPGMLSLLDERIPGVNTTYLYAGLWKATFSWHLEDQDLYSINYLHFGAPKQWYSIPQADKEKLDDVMRLEFPNDAKKCKEFLRHKTFMASPKYLTDRGVRVNKIVHNAGEFIITYPFGYHAGFNYGYNLAEATNFASEEWVPFAKKTARCLCITDSVQIDIKDLLKRWRNEKHKHKNDIKPVIPLKRPASEVISLDTDDEEEEVEKGKGKGKEGDEDCMVFVPNLESPTDYRSSPMIPGTKPKARSSEGTAKDESKASLTKSHHNNQEEDISSQSGEGSEDDQVLESDADSDERNNYIAPGVVPEAFDYETEESQEDSEDDYEPETSKRARNYRRTLKKIKKTPVKAPKEAKPKRIAKPMPKAKAGSRSSSRGKTREIEVSTSIEAHQDLTAQDAPTSDSDSSDQQCFLCPSILPKPQTKYEDFKILPTNQYLDSDIDRFVHLFCAKTLNPASITKDHTGLRFVDLKSIKLNGCKTCLFCSTKVGVTLGCSKRNCSVWFHPICGQESGVHFNHNGDHLCSHHAPSTDMREHFLKRLEKDQLVQFKVDDGFALGIVQKIDHEQRRIEVIEFPLGAGDSISAKFSDIVNLDGIKITKLQSINRSPKKAEVVEEIVSDNSEEYGDDGEKADEEMKLDGFGEGLNKEELAELDDLDDLDIPDFTESQCTEGMQLEKALLEENSDLEIIDISDDKDDLEEAFTDQVAFSPSSVVEDLKEEEIVELMTSEEPQVNAEFSVETSCQTITAEGIIKPESISSDLQTNSTASHETDSMIDPETADTNHPSAVSSVQETTPIQDEFINTKSTTEESNNFAGQVESTSDSILISHQELQQKHEALIRLKSLKEKSPGPMLDFKITELRDGKIQTTTATTTYTSSNSSTVSSVEPMEVSSSQSDLCDLKA